jgi:DNA-binding MarR family transcriptional regulator
MAATVTLGTDHLTAWGELARAHAAVTGRVQEALTDAGLPPLTWYELLDALADCDEQGMRMTDLAGELIISRGGLTKLLDRLVKAGLVERASCDTDRRLTYARILPAGDSLFEEMRPVVVAELQRAFVEAITDEEARSMATALGRVQTRACSTEP